MGSQKNQWSRQLDRLLFEKVTPASQSKSIPRGSRKARQGTVVKLESALRNDAAFIDKLKRLVSMAEAGEVYGVAIVIDHGGGEYEYGGDGSFVTSPLIGYAVTMKLAKKFL